MTYPSERKFRIGQRVRLSKSGKEILLPWKKKMTSSTKGTVKAHFSPLGVIVHVDGYAKPTSYHMDFWEPIPASPSTRSQKR